MAHNELDNDLIIKSGQWTSLQKQDVSCTFSLAINPNAATLMDWLQILDGPLSLDARDLGTAVSRDDGRLWFEVVLRLSLALMHILRIPIFKPPMVRTVIAEPRKVGIWKAVCQRPDPALVPPRVFDGVLKVAFKLATWCSNADPDSSEDRQRFFQFIRTDIRRPFAKVMPRGKSTIEVLRVAHHLNIPYLPLPGGAFQLGMGSAGCRIERSTTDHDSALGMRWTKNKRFTAQLLRKAGLPAPSHVAVKSLVQAKRASEHIGFPLVVKPSDLERGEGVTVDVQADNLEASFNRAVKRSPSKRVLIEQQVPGVCHRLFVLDGKLLYAVRRLPIGIYANGQSTIKDLVNAECQSQQRMPPWKRSGIHPLDDLAFQMLDRQGWTADSIPEAGRFVALRQIETTALGGVDEDVTSTIHYTNVKAAIQATKLFGLQVAGVDIISQDISQPWNSNGAIISEVNYAPLLGGGEISRSYIPTFLKTLIRNEGRIPILVHFGGSEALVSAQEEWKGLVNSGLRATFVCSQKVLMSDGVPYIMTSDSLYDRCRALTLLSDVDALVIAVQDDEFLQSGLPFDSVSMVQDTGGELSSHQEKRLLVAKEASNLRRVFNSWARCAKTDVSEA